jgi:hypothetical protein
MGRVASNLLLLFSAITSIFLIDYYLFLTGSGAFTEILGGETERSLFYEYRE